MQRGLSRVQVIEPEVPANDEIGHGPDQEPHSYLELYGFARAPFAAEAAQGEFVPGESHRSVLEALAGAMIAGQSAVVLTGEAQTGKSTLLDTAIRLVAARKLRVLRVHNPRPGPLSLKRLLSALLGIPEPLKLTEADSARAHQLLTAGAPGEAHTVLAIDDADTLSLGALRYLAQLCRHEKAKAPQLVLVGAPGIWPLLRQAEFRSLAARINVRLRLGRLSPEETRAYIERRLWMAGSETRKVLSPAAVTEVVARTEGIPGRINAALDRVFAAGFEHRHPRVTPQTVRAALGVPRPPTFRTPTASTPPPIWLIAGTILAVGLGSALYANRAALPEPSDVITWAKGIATQVR
ncbi:MAG: AAA family ATPase [Rhodospirillales bacterium]|nr:AAA family ATPase [Rhodospirillales bacterium]